LERGYCLVYEPEASVYHYHGINHDENLERCRNVVKVLESYDINEIITQNHINIEELNISAIIPVKGQVPYLGSKPLLTYTLERALESRYLNRIVVATDNEECARIAERAGVMVVMRPPELSLEYVDVDDVLRHVLGELEKGNIFSDLVMLLEITYPLRQKGFIDELICRLIERGLDSVLPVHREYKSCWVKEGDGVRRVDQGFLPRQYKEPIYIGLKGLGFITHPGFIREGNSLGQRVGIMEVADPISTIEVRDAISFYLGEKLIGEWWDKEESVSLDNEGT